MVTALTSGTDSARHHLSQLPSSVQEPLREAGPDQRATLALLLLRLQESGFTSSMRRGYGSGATSLQRARAALYTRLRDVRARLSRARKAGAFAPAGAASDTEASGDEAAVGAGTEADAPPGPGERRTLGSAEAEAAREEVSRLEEDEVALRHALELLERTRQWGVVHLRQRVEMLEDVMRRDPEDEDVRVELSRARRALEEGEALTAEAEDARHWNAPDSGRGSVAALWQGVGGTESDAGGDAGWQGADGTATAAATGSGEGGEVEGGATATATAPADGGETRVVQVDWFWATFVFRESAGGLAQPPPARKRPVRTLRRMATQQTMEALTELDGEGSETAPPVAEGASPQPPAPPQGESGVEGKQGEGGAGVEGSGGSPSTSDQAAAATSGQPSPGGGRRKRRGMVKFRQKRCVCTVGANCWPPSVDAPPPSQCVFTAPRAVNQAPNDGSQAPIPSSGAEAGGRRR